MLSATKFRLKTPLRVWGSNDIAFFFSVLQSFFHWHNLRLRLEMQIKRFQLFREVCDFTLSVGLQFLCKSNLVAGRMCEI